MTAQPSLFDGETYDPALDEDRLATALGRVYQVLSDGTWYTIAQVAHLAQCSEAGASARMRDLRKWRFGHHIIERQRVSGGLWRYRMVK